MSSAIQRQTVQLGGPKVAGIGGPQFGMGRIEAQDTSGGISPIGQAVAPVAPAAPEAGLGGGGLLDSPFTGGPNGDGNLHLPLTGRELGSMLRPKNGWSMYE